MYLRFSSVLLIAVVAVFSTASVGCKKPEDKVVAKKDDSKKPAVKHEGYWCQEHGIPEAICSLCSDEVAEKHKKAGDWCKIHDRALSQCFKCDPSKYKKFEQMYVDNFGKKPEPPPEEEFKK